MQEGGSTERPGVRGALAEDREHLLACLVCVCICVSVCAHVCAYVSLCIMCALCQWEYMSVYAQGWGCAQVCLPACVCLCVNMCICVYLCVSVCRHVCAFMWISVCMCECGELGCTCVHMGAHTAWRGSWQSPFLGASVSIAFTVTSTAHL
jgi:hypothetical protein